MKQPKKYLRANRDQQLLLPPDVSCYINDGHFARWLVRIIDLLDLSKFCELYEHDEMDPSGRGRPPYHPSMLLAILIYGASRRVWTFRRLEQMTYSDVGARYITGNLHPDHSCLAKFRKQHAEAIGELFAQVVLACHQAGIVDLQNVALDSVVVPADASRQSSVKISELERKFDEAKAIAKSLMDKMEAAELAEREMLSKELRQASNREKKLQEAIEFLRGRESQPGFSSQEASNEAQDSEEQQQTEAVALRGARKLKGLTLRGLAQLLGVSTSTLHAWEQGKYRVASDRREFIRSTLDLDDSSLPDLLPKPQADSKKIPPPTSVILSDFESYWIYRPGPGYRVGYLGMATVDSKCQVILDASVSKRNADAPNLIPSVERIYSTFSRWPTQFSGDTGFYSHDNQDFMESKQIEFYCPPQPLQKGHEPSEKSLRMKEKLATPEGRAAYNTRSGIVEPVFGNIKVNMGFGKFWTVQHNNVSCEWTVACLTHNLLKLFRHATTEIVMKALSSSR
jgi:transposase/DNA-binding transcriptional regulator YiaG